ncbi:MAG: hypothetical protein ACHRHE_08865 [Tepidisphaerales bacterium]
MDPSSNKLLTPIYHNHGETGFPQDPAFYMLGSNGLFYCRNTEFFSSCVPARGWPLELSAQRTFMKLRYPKMDRRQFELVIGFFSRVFDQHRSEAAIIPVWDRRQQRIRLVVPPQEATVTRGYSGKCYPNDVHYEIPGLPPHQFPLGDIHSHGDGAAYASWMDKSDETFRAGLHIVVGRIDRDPPDVHIEAVVDGHRFAVAPESVIEGYQRRRLGVPKEWMDQVTVKVETYSSYSTQPTTYVQGQSSSYSIPVHKEARNDRSY